MILAAAALAPAHDAATTGTGRGDPDGLFAASFATLATAAVDPAVPVAGVATPMLRPPTATAAAPVAERQPASGNDLPVSTPVLRGEALPQPAAIVPDPSSVLTPAAAPSGPARLAVARRATPHDDRPGDDTRDDAASQEDAARSAGPFVAAAIPIVAAVSTQGLAQVPAQGLGPTASVDVRPRNDATAVARSGSAVQPARPEAGRHGRTAAVAGAGPNFPADVVLAEPSDPLVPSPAVPRTAGIATAASAIEASTAPGRAAPLRPPMPITPAATAGLAVSTLRSTARDDAPVPASDRLARALLPPAGAIPLAPASAIADNANGPARIEVPPATATAPGTVAAATAAWRSGTAVSSTPPPPSSAMLPQAATDVPQTPTPGGDGQRSTADPLPPGVAATPAPAIPVPPRTGPAAQVFAAALHQAARRDERDGDRGFALVGSGGEAAPIAAAAPAAAAPLDPSLPRFPHAMIDRIERMRDAVDAADTRIRLVPDALGAIDVTLRRDGDTVHVHLAAEQAATRTLLAEAQPRLAELAEARGLKLGGTSVDAGAGGQGRRDAPPAEPATPAASIRTPSTPASSTPAAHVDDADARVA